MFKGNTIAALCLLAALTLCCVAAEQQDRWIAVLQSNAPKAQKAIACKYLAIYGTGKAVPALASVLGDPQLSSWARIGLEAIEGPEADGALRQALGKLEGRLLVGVINSIGVREDPQAVELLIACLKKEDAEVVQAAAAALGHIGTGRAVAALKELLQSAPQEAVRSAAAEGLILCAEKLALSGKREAALQIYDEVRHRPVPLQRIVEATRGAIILRGKEAAALLQEQLLSPTEAFFLLGLTVSRELPGPEVTEALSRAFTKVSARRQARVLLALGDRRDRRCLPVVLRAASRGERQVRLTALEVLAELGDRSCMAELLAAAASQDKDISGAAQRALTQLHGEGVDADLVAELREAKGRTREVLIEVVGARGITGATEELKKAASDPRGAIRKAALRALGATTGGEDLSFLIERLFEPRDQEEGRAAQQALRTACLRMPDREACARRLLEALHTMPVSPKATARKKRWDAATRAWRWVAVSPRSTLLEILGALGGDTALRGIGEAAKGTDQELRETAIEVLARWLSGEAAPVLLQAAKSARTSRDRLAALWGLVRLLRSLELPPAERVALYREALGVAQTVREKKLIIVAMKDHPSVEVLRCLVEAAKDPALKKEAGAAALAVAQKLGRGKVQVEKLLSLAGQRRLKVEIISAKYGAEKKFVDVTETLRRYVRDTPVVVLPSSSYNASFGGDPVPGVVKELRIHYRIEAREGKAVFKENDPIVLPVP